MLEIKNPDDSWPKKIQLKLCVYPHIDNIKLCTFDVLDTVGRLQLFWHTNN